MSTSTIHSSLFHSPSTYRNDIFQRSLSIRNRFANVASIIRPRWTRYRSRLIHRHKGLLSRTLAFYILHYLIHPRIGKSTNFNNPRQFKIPSAISPQLSVQYGPEIGRVWSLDIRYMLLSPHSLYILHYFINLQIIETTNFSYPSHFKIASPMSPHSSFKDRSDLEIASAISMNTQEYVHRHSQVFINCFTPNLSNRPISTIPLISKSLHQCRLNYPSNMDPRSVAS
jgi:hypothetical protein